MPSSNRHNSKQRNVMENGKNHRHSYQSSPGPENRPISIYSKSQNFHTKNPIPTSAYFLDRIDVDNYSNQALMSFVDSVLLKSKNKGLKVKLSLPDDGLLIDNVREPDQSWIFKRSELLYLWHDHRHSPIIVVITKNRSRRHSNLPFSASFFRLKSTSSIEQFLQAAQQFFGQISDSFRSFDTVRSLNGKPKNRNRLTIHDPTSSAGSLRIRRESSRNSTPIRLITRTEFDPGKPPQETNNDIFLHDHRTFSETTSSTDSQFVSSKQDFPPPPNRKDDTFDDEYNLNQYFSPDNINELLRELKQLRNQIAELKLEKSTRTISTSPSSNSNTKENKESWTSMDENVLTSEADAETQTDFTFGTHKRRRVSKRNKKTMVGSAVGINEFNRKLSPSSGQNELRAFSISSTTTASDQDDTVQENSSQITDSSIEISVQQMNPEPAPTFITPLPPRPTLIKTNATSLPMPSIMLNNEANQSSNGFSNEQRTVTSLIPVLIDKEIVQYAPTNVSASTAFNNADLQSTIVKEHIYENVPTIMQNLNNRLPSYQNPIGSVSEDESKAMSKAHVVYYPAANDLEAQNRTSVNNETTPSISPPSKETNGFTVVPFEMAPTQRPQIISMGRHRSQPVYFANHLTNPMFAADKQLLVNTIANQFGVDLNSPQLQNLICNQHLFVTRKRTFANMVWQMTPDEETVLRSIPNDSNSIDLIDERPTNTSSILKSNKTINGTSKGRSISWDRSLE